MLLLSGETSDTRFGRGLRFDICNIGPLQALLRRLREKKL